MCTVSRLLLLSQRHSILRLALCGASNEKGMQDFELEALAQFAVDLETEATSIANELDAREMQTLKKIDDQEVQP